MVYSTDRRKKYTLDLASDPEISNDENWVVARKEIPLLKQIQSEENNAGMQTGMILLNTVSGKIKGFENVRDFSFSNYGRWLLYSLFKRKRKMEPVITARRIIKFRNRKQV